LSFESILPLIVRDETTRLFAGQEQRRLELLGSALSVRVG
jgi:hypothetical protein